MLPSSTRLMQIAMETARDAAPVALAGFRKPITIDTKRDFHDMVTEFDRATEERIRERLLAAVPASCIVGEEGGKQGEGDVVWYVDPIDGTANFARGIAFWCISIAAAVDGKVRAGAVYVPVGDLMFHADETGVWLNGEPLAARGARKPADATIFGHYPMPGDLQQDAAIALGEYGDLVNAYAAVRNLGSGALSLLHVAAGWADGTFCFATNAWDVAAASFILKQAGGVYHSYCAGEVCPEEGDFLRPHYFGSVAGADFPDIDAIMRRGSRLLDASAAEKAS